MIAVAPDAPMFLGISYEFSALALALLTAIHCYHKRGRSETLKIFGIGMIYGLVLENGGPLHLPLLGFEGYFYEENYKLYLFEFFGYGRRISLVPICTHAGWPVVFYLAVSFWDRICDAFPSVRSRLWLSSLIMAASGLLFDLNFDVLATRFNWWVWHERFSGLWFGVPLINYIAWFWALFVFGWCWAWLHQRPGWSQRRICIYLALCVPVMWVVALIGVTASKYLFGALGWLYVG